MKRRAILSLAGALAALVLAGLAAEPCSGPRAEQLADVPHLWRWAVAVPGAAPRPGAVGLVVRTKRFPADPIPAPEALGPGDGVDKVLQTEDVEEGERTEAVVLLHLNDLRGLGFNGDVEWPLRMAATFGTNGSAQLHTINRVDGRIVLGTPAYHRGGWSDGELPLMTLRTADEGNVWLRTYLLTTKLPQ